jgi:hypothetical protein
VLVIAESEMPFVKRQGYALQKVGRRSFGLDLLMFTAAEAAKAAAVPGSAVYFAEREWRVLFAA